MRTSKLSINLGAYSDSSWHIALVQTEYERGRIVSSQILADRVLYGHQVERATMQAVARIMRIEMDRIQAEAARDRTHSPVGG